MAKPVLTKRIKPVDPRLLDRDMEIVEAFTRVYCRSHHEGSIDGLCAECRELIEYARERRQKCPYDPKPKCKACPTHCYHPTRRVQIRAVMRFSGLYYIKRGRLDWLLKYFLQK